MLNVVTVILLQVKKNRIAAIKPMAVPVLKCLLALNYRMRL